MCVLFKKNYQLKLVLRRVFFQVFSAFLELNLNALYY